MVFAALLLFCLALVAPAAAQRDCYGAVIEVAVVSQASSTPIDAVYGYPGPFGQPLNDTASAPFPLAAADPLNACGGSVAEAPVPGAAAIVSRGNCSFVEKAWALQRAGYGAMLLFNDEEECVLMSANRSDAQGLTLAVASLTQEAGTLLQQLLADHAGDGLAVVLRMPAEGPIDWSAIALWVIATGVITVAGLTTQLSTARDSSTPTARKAGASDVPSVTISSRAAVGFVVLASVMLLTLFFFLDKWLAYILVTLFALGAWQACGMVAYALLNHMSSQQWRGTYIRLPAVGVVPANGAVATLLAGGLCVTWAVWHNAVWSWPLQDVMGVCFMLVILRQFLLPNLKVAAILLSLTFVYDVWWVFLQPLVTGGASVMVEVATGGASHEQLPMVLRVPHHVLGTNPAFALLGLGDIVLPGLLAIFCRRFDQTHRLGPARSYFWPCLAGYGAGLLVTYCALWFSWFGDEGQPALLYLVPGTLGTVSLLALSRGQLSLLWNNDFEEPLGGMARGDSAPRDAAERLEAGLEQLLPDGEHR